MRAVMTGPPFQGEARRPCCSMPAALRQLWCVHWPARQRAIGGRCARLRGAPRRGHGLCEAV